jgi:hypothetical protein
MRPGGHCVARDRARGPRLQRSQDRGARRRPEGRRSSSDGRPARPGLHGRGADRRLAAAPESQGEADSTPALPSGGAVRTRAGGGARALPGRSLDGADPVLRRGAGKPRRSQALRPADPVGAADAARPGIDRGVVRRRRSAGGDPARRAARRALPPGRFRGTPLRRAPRRPRRRAAQAAGSGSRGLSRRPVDLHRAPAGAPVHAT